MNTEMAVDIPTKRMDKNISMVHSRQRERILIAGLGNVLLQDDGVGVHAIRELRKNPQPGILGVEVGTAVLDALHLFEWADKILAIDAMQAGGLPGTIYVFGMKDVEELGFQTSLHELSLLSALRFLPKHVHPEVMVLGIEPETIDYGMNLSSSLQAALPQLVTVAGEIVTDWKEKSPKANSTKHMDINPTFLEDWRRKRGEL